MTAPKTLDVQGKLTINGKTLETLMQDVIDKTLAGRCGVVLMLLFCRAQERQTAIARKKRT